jgi:hypothetical protein
MKDIKLIGEGILCFVLLTVAFILVVCCERAGLRGFTTHSGPA